MNLAPERREFTNAPAIMLAWAYNITELVNEILQCRAIYANGTMVGLICFSYFPNNEYYKEPCYRIRPFMVDADEMGKGYEATALQALIAELRTKPFGEATAIFASYHPDDAEMVKFHETAGFVKTEFDFSDDDIIARLSL